MGYMNDKIIMGYWDGEPIWRYKTAQEKLNEALGENKHEIANLYIAINEV